MTGKMREARNLEDVERLSVRLRDQEERLRPVSGLRLHYMKRISILKILEMKFTTRFLILLEKITRCRRLHCQKTLKVISHNQGVGVSVSGVRLQGLGFQFQVLDFRVRGFSFRC